MERGWKWEVYVEEEQPLAVDLAMLPVQFPVTLAAAAASLGFLV